MTRKIIHIDMDAFFASVEQRDNPVLRNRPVVVGGNPDSRGVVAAASYEARQFGIHSAMPCSQAYRKCPQATFVKPRFEAYREVSQQIHAIFSQYSDLIEPLSLDEAYLDVTENKVNNPSATHIAETIRQQIKQQTQLTASAGVSYNKFLAKIASDINKPNGIKVVLPEEGEAFVAKLAIGQFYGIGQATEKKMRALDIENGAQLKEKSLDFLIKNFGKSGSFFYKIARGIDERVVNNTRIRKSLGSETTFSMDILNRDELLKYLSQLVKEVSEDLLKKKLKGKTVTLKVKFDDFVQVTRSKTIERKINDYDTIYSLCKMLLTKTDAGQRKVRLLGVSLSSFEDLSDENGLEKKPMQQLELDLSHTLK
ncbi:MAG: DNA polymerase IV [Gammaproteobacteria bacterium]|nr:DNA polymerase IV [Gammaproteobacteria bacterium]